jgi:hypothetical protein
MAGNRTRGRRADTTLPHAIFPQRLVRRRPHRLTHHAAIVNKRAAPTSPRPVIYVLDTNALSAVCQWVPRAPLDLAKSQRAYAFVQP